MTEKTNDEIRRDSVRISMKQDKENDGFMPSRLQEMVSDNSPYSGPFKGDPFFDPWAPGGSFNKR